MSVLLIDNNDSFTYNIIEAIRSVCSDKWQIVRSEALDIGMLDRFSHIVISPGPMTPSDFPILSEVICRCYDHNKPLLGICLGHQAIGAEQCLMSLQHTDKHIYGIQFHPESFMTPDGSRILSNFINI